MIDKVTTVSKVKLGRVTCLRVPDPGQGQRQGMELRPHPTFWHVVNFCGRHLKNGCG
jgi:hypothetical protein